MGDEDKDEDGDDNEEAADDLEGEMPPMEMPAEETPAEVPMEAMHKDKKKMDEYKIQKSADTADHSDKGAKSPLQSSSNKPVNSANAKGINQGGADEKGRPAPNAQKMSDFENSPGKDKGTSYKKEMKPVTADGSEKSAKSPITGK